MAAAQSLSLRGRLSVFAGDIKIHHTVFALPWALLSAALAGRWHPGSLTAGKIGLILLCMVTARTVGMAANRLLDAELDARNPRTARRAIPAGKLSRGFFTGVLAVCCIVFCAAAAMFEILYRNPWPVILALPVLAYLACYPLMKRFTQLCHFYLGAALGLAPMCAWLAVTGRVDWPAVVMSVAVLAWTAGFDIIYACQDFASDRETGVFSVPARVGIGGALWISRLTHVAAAAAIVLLAWRVPQFHLLFALAAGMAIALLAIEQSLVRADDLSKVNLSFFTINGVISVLVGAMGIVDLLR